MIEIERRGALLGKGRVNLQKAAEIVMTDYRAGEIGRITLETPEEFAAWTEAGLPVETADASFFPSDYQGEWTDQWRATTAEVTAMVADGSAELIDARPADFFDGLTWSVASPGTIQGADNLEYSAFFDGTRLVGAEAIRAAAAEAGYTGGTTAVSFCNTGHWAAINWFALSEVAGYDDVRLYAESMAEYAADGSQPLDNAPNRLQYAWRAATNWVGSLF